MYNVESKHKSPQDGNVTDAWMSVSDDGNTTALGNQSAVHHADAKGGRSCGDKQACA